MTAALSWRAFGEVVKDLVMFFRVLKQKVKIVQTATASAVNAGMNFAFDYVFYTLLLLFFKKHVGGIGGIVLGGLVAGYISAIICKSLIQEYDKRKKDYLAIEAIKEAAKESRVVSWLFQRTLILFVILCMKFDPLITTLVLRKGSFNGLTQRDRQIFWTSVVVSNAYWTLVIITGINLSELMFGWIQINVIPFFSQMLFGGA